MGGIWLTGSSLRGTVGDIAGTKSGLALSFEELLDHTAPTYHDVLQIDNDEVLRIRSEEFEELVHGVLYRLGYMPHESPLPPMVRLYKKYKEKPGFDEANFYAIMNLAASVHSSTLKEAVKSGSKSLDPTPIYTECSDKYGPEGGILAIEYIKAIQEAVDLNVFGSLFSRYTDIDPVQLSDLFRSESLDALAGKYIDQRYIDYLSKNFDSVDNMNWRKFEGLTAEYFHREGYQVEIGPGRNDDGIDLRVWRNKGDAGLPPLLLVQCKRQKSTVDKVVVKAMYADIDEHNAKSGMIVTTNKLSVGAQKTIEARQYPITEADRETVRKWIQAMRTPWAGIFMSE